MKKYDVVRLLVDKPDHGLSVGDTGTILEDDLNEYVLVEFDATNKDDFPLLSVKRADLEVIWEQTA